MDTPNEEIHATTVEARGGRRGNRVRLILVVSLVLALVAMAAVFLGGASGPNQSGTAPSEEASGGASDGAGDAPAAMAS